MINFPESFSRRAYHPVLCPLYYTGLLAYSFFSELLSLLIIMKVQRQRD